MALGRSMSMRRGEYLPHVPTGLQPIADRATALPVPAGGSLRIHPRVHQPTRACRCLTRITHGIDARNQRAAIAVRLTALRNRQAQAVPTRLQLHGVEALRTLARAQRYCDGVRSPLSELKDNCRTYAAQYETRWESIQLRRRSIVPRIESVTERTIRPCLSMVRA
jgi:hypothetical protein